MANEELKAVIRSHLKEGAEEGGDQAWHEGLGDQFTELWEGIKKHLDPETGTHAARYGAAGAPLGLMVYLVASGKERGLIGALASMAAGGMLGAGIGGVSDAGEIRREEGPMPREVSPGDIDISDDKVVYSPSPVPDVELDSEGEPVGTWTNFFRGMVRLGLPIDEDKWYRDEETGQWTTDDPNERAQLKTLQRGKTTGEIGAYTAGTAGVIGVGKRLLGKWSNYPFNRPEPGWMIRKLRRLRGLPRHAIPHSAGGAAIKIPLIGAALEEGLMATTDPETGEWTTPTLAHRRPHLEQTGRDITERHEADTFSWEGLRRAPGSILSAISPHNTYRQIMTTAQSIGDRVEAEKLQQETADKVHRQVADKVHRQEKDLRDKIRRMEGRGEKVPQHIKRQY